MLPVQISYPAFEANQVLSNEHLNQLFAYLDEQERLTRTNLIGIGIVCGLEPTAAEDGASMRISKGVGVTSEGYLIVWPDAAPLEWYRPYTVPERLPYHEFEDRTGASPQPFPLWELTPDRNNDPDAARLSRDFLTGTNQPEGEDDEKILVLFLECLAEDNRNCTPNSCADKGSTVTATVRPLLVRRQDIDLLLERIRNLGPATEAYFTLAESMSTRLGLPTVRLPRFDVAATGLNSTASVFDAFQRVLSQPVVTGVASALQAAYDAFRPLLPDFDTSPFANLPTEWTFLYDGSIATTNRYLWYQYYFDHLDTIIQAYDEFRLRGLEVLGLCCPDSRLFPRHLMLANMGENPPGYDYRNTFVPSPLFTRQLGAIQELRRLFQRIVLLVRNLELPPNVGSFTGIAGVSGITSIADITGISAVTGISGITNITAAPSVRPINESLTIPGSIRNPQVTNSPYLLANFEAIAANLNLGNLTAFRPRLVTEIKITPSKLASPLSEKALPYHYRPIPLYEYWNYQLTRQGKARENLGYRSPAWNNTDDFVRFPLNYELEPYNFLRVEGHIGQNFVAVLNEVLSQKDRFRLPIDVVALKTGRNADNIPLPEEVEECHFQDLEALYDSLREEFLCQICETVMRLYNTPVLTNEQPSGSTTYVPNLPFLRRCAPNFRYFIDTVGQLYENNLNSHGPAGPSFANVPFSYYAHTYYIFFLVQLAERLSDSLTGLDFTTFSSRHENFFNVVRSGNIFLLALTNDEIDGSNNIYPGVDLEELQDLLDMLLYSCKLEPIQSVWEEYQRRLERVREGLLLSTFARKHPGLTHKAGVPKGGTLVLVYHGENQQGDTNVQTGRFVLRGRITIDGEVIPGINIFVGPALSTTTDVDGNFVLVVYELPVVLRVSAPGIPAREILVTDDLTLLEIDLNDTDGGNMPDRFPELAVGAVIADFYLPYLCCSDCHPVQFVLPKAPPTFSWEQVGCTDPNFGGAIRIEASGGVPPYEVTTNEGQTWVEIGEDPISVNHGATVRIRDAEGTESTARTIQLAPPLNIDPGAIECSEDGTTFTVQIYISGGRPPYRLIQGDQSTVVPANQPGIATFASGQGGEVIIQDSSDPPCERAVNIEPHVCEQACNLPCDGITLECGHPFWLQRNASNELAYLNVQLTVTRFIVQGDASSQVVVFGDDQLAVLTEILNPNGDFTSVGGFSQFWNSAMPQANDFIQEVMTEAFGSEAGTVITLRYDPDGVGRFSTLWIETYECFRYIFEVQLEYLGANGKSRFLRGWQYTSEGTNVREQSENLSGEESEVTSASVPRYNCVRRDRCNPDASPVELCQDPFEVSIVQDPTAGGNIVLGVVPQEVVANNAIIWDVQYGIPSLASQPFFDCFLIPTVIGITAWARVLVVNPATGCAAFAEVEIPPQG